MCHTQAVVDYEVLKTANHDLASLLDQSPDAPNINELKAIEMIAQLVAQCVKLEGKEQPTMTEIVVVLEETLTYTSNGQSQSHSSATT